MTNRHGAYVYVAQLTMTLLKTGRSWELGKPRRLYGPGASGRDGGCATGQQGWEHPREVGQVGGCGHLAGEAPDAEGFTWFSCKVTVVP